MTVIGPASVFVFDVTMFKAKKLVILLGKLRFRINLLSVKSLIFSYPSVLKYVSNVRQLFATDDFSRQHFQMHFLLALIQYILRESQPQNPEKWRILHECSCFIEFIKRVGEKR